MVADKEEIKAISRLLSGSNSAQHRNGIIIGHSLGLKPIDMVMLFLENRQGWGFEIDRHHRITMLECTKTLCGNEFGMDYNFYEHYPAQSHHVDVYFETYLNGFPLKKSIQLPNGIKRKSTPMGKLVYYLLKLINREISHLKKHTVY